MNSIPPPSGSPTVLSDLPLYFWIAGFQLSWMGLLFGSVAPLIGLPLPALVGDISFVLGLVFSLVTLSLPRMLVIQIDPGRTVVTLTRRSLFLKTVNEIPLPGGRVG